MLGQADFANIPYTWQYYFGLLIIVLMIIAIVGATLLGLPKIQSIYQRIIQKVYGYAIYQLTIIVLFAVSILFMVNSTYSPFIYFQY